MVGNHNRNWQYTRPTRLWFHRELGLRNQSKPGRKPQRQCKPTMRFNTSTTGASRCAQSIHGRCHAAQDRPTSAHAEI